MIVCIDRRKDTGSETSTPMIQIKKSKHPDRHWIKKKKIKGHYKNKGSIFVNKDDGYIQANRVTPTKASEMKMYKAFQKAIPSFEICADKGYTSTENNTLLKS